MQVPLQISFREIEPSDAVTQRIHKKVELLEKMYGGIISCRVVIDKPHRQHHKGNIYLVRVDLRVPGEEIAINRNPSQHIEHSDIYAALRDTFAAAQRELQDYVRRRRGFLKTSERPPHGKVIRLVKSSEEMGDGTDGDFGFIETSDQREIYFHRNSVLNRRYDELKVGMEVRFSESQGNQGPQASTIEVIGHEGRHEAA